MVGTSGYTPFMLQEIVDGGGEGGPVSGGTPDEHTADLIVHIEPFMKVEGQAVGARETFPDFVESRTDLREMAPKAPSIADSHNPSCAAICASASRSSMAPVLTVPALPTMQKGIRTLPCAVLPDHFFHYIYTDPVVRIYRYLAEVFARCRSRSLPRP